MLYKKKNILRIFAYIYMELLAQIAGWCGIGCFYAVLWRIFSGREKKIWIFIILIMLGPFGLIGLVVIFVIFIVKCIKHRLEKRRKLSLEEIEIRKKKSYRRAVIFPVIAVIILLIATAILFIFTEVTPGWILNKFSGFVNGLIENIF